MQSNETAHKPIDSNTGYDMCQSFNSNNEERIKDCIAKLELGKTLTGLDDGKTPLMYAAWGGYYIATKLLLDKSQVRNDINYKYNGSSALKLAVDHGCFDIVRLLIANGATVTKDIKKAASQGKNQDIIALLDDPIAIASLKPNPPAVIISAPTTYATRESSCIIL